MSEIMKDIGNVTEQVEKLVRDSVRTTVLSGTPEPEGYYMLVGPDGEARKCTAEPKRFRATLSTPDELAKYAMDAAANTFRVEKPHFYVEEAGAAFVFSSQSRLDIAVCPLTISEPYEWLKSEAGHALSQRDLIRVLRIVFRGCLANSDLLALIRNLKFDRTTDGSGDIQHGRESMGRQLTAQVKGLNAIPEEFALDVPVWNNFGKKQRVCCALEIDPQAETFTITPYPVELFNAMQSSLVAVRDLLAAQAKLPAFIGKP